jgi:hypothetical protein
MQRDEILEQLTLNQRVVGSSPTAPTNFLKDLAEASWVRFCLGVTSGLQIARKTV